MNFTTYLDQAWTDHATQSERVASEFGFGTTMIETTEQLIRIAMSHKFIKYFNKSILTALIKI